MNHEKLECYRRLLEVAKWVEDTVAHWPREYGYLVDQLRRAISSATLNLAEGNAKRDKPLERRRFFQISMGSIAEVSACLDLASVFRLISAKEQEEKKEMLRASYCMIRKLP